MSRDKTLLKFPFVMVFLIGYCSPGRNYYKSSFKYNQSMLAHLFDEFYVCHQKNIGTVNELLASTEMCLR